LPAHDAWSFCIYVLFNELSQSVKAELLTATANYPEEQKSKLDRLERDRT